MQNSVFMVVLSTVLHSSLSMLLAPDERFRENSAVENNLDSVNVQGQARANRRDVCNWDEQIFQLKMFWEDGMEWQQSSSERGWCAERYDCEEKAEVYIRECDEDDDKQQWIFGKCTVRPVCDPKLCITAGVAKSDSQRGDIQLRTCDPDDNDEIQYFVTFDPKDVSDKFQFKFFDKRDDLCLTQEHHPKDWESLRFEYCKVAEENDRGVYDDTSYWVVGEFNGHTPTSPTKRPTKSPTRKPTKEPSREPTSLPTSPPTSPPTSKPKKPTNSPKKKQKKKKKKCKKKCKKADPPKKTLKKCKCKTTSPTSAPTIAPTSMPTSLPTFDPTESSAPTIFNFTNFTNFPSFSPNT